MYRLPLPSSNLFAAVLQRAVRGLGTQSVGGQGGKQTTHRQSNAPRFQWHDLKFLFAWRSQIGAVIPSSGLSSVFPNPQGAEKCSARVEEMQPNPASIGRRSCCSSTGPAGMWPGGHSSAPCSLSVTPAPDPRTGVRGGAGVSGDI